MPKTNFAQHVRQNTMNKFQILTSIKMFKTKCALHARQILGIYFKIWSLIRDCYPDYWPIYGCWRWWWRTMLLRWFRDVASKQWRGDCEIMVAMVPVIVGDSPWVGWWLQYWTVAMGCDCGGCNGRPVVFRLQSGLVCLNVCVCVVYVAQNDWETHNLTPELTNKLCNKELSNSNKENSEKLLKASTIVPIWNPKGSWSPFSNGNSLGQVLVIETSQRDNLHTTPYISLWDRLITSTTKEENHR